MTCFKIKGVGNETVVNKTISETPLDQSIPDRIIKFLQSFIFNFHNNRTRRSGNLFVLLFPGASNSSSGSDNSSIKPLFIPSEARVPPLAVGDRGAGLEQGPADRQGPGEVPQLDTPECRRGAASGGRERQQHRQTVCHGGRARAPGHGPANG